jgi:hypothetical protein
MKILISGVNSQLAKALTPLFDSEIELLPLGRHASNIPWTLGVRPDPGVLTKNTINACIHFAWSMNDRANDTHLNIGGTAQLSAWCDEARIPFLFISSLAVEGKSEYGKSKLKAEKYVRENNGYIIRPGLVIDSNKYAGSKSKFFQVIPISKETEIPISTLQDVSTAIDFWLVNIAANNRLSDLGVSKRYVNIAEVFKTSAKFPVPIPLTLIELLLKILSPMSLTARNYLDSLSSLRSNKEGMNY